MAGLVPQAESETIGQANRYHQVNTLGTANLARQCARHGVKRFVFVSTVKVLGEGAALLGGSPTRLLRLAPAAQTMLDRGRLEVHDAQSAQLARTLLDTVVPGYAPDPAAARARRSPRAAITATTSSAPPTTANVRF